MQTIIKVAEIFLGARAPLELAHVKKNKKKMKKFWNSMILPYLSCYCPNLDETLNVGSWEHLE